MTPVTLQGLCICRLNPQDGNAHHGHVLSCVLKESFQTSFTHEEIFQAVS